MVLIREWRQTSSLDRFLVADRNVRGVVGSMSIAASWIWAPAIFISTQTGYTWGLSGLVWFVVPNALALILFAPLAARVRASLPHGYSLIDHLRRGDPSFVALQTSMQLGMQVFIYSIQLVAGAELLSSLTGSSYSWMVVAMGLLPLTYSLFSGLRTSVFTDAIQYVVIASIAFSMLFAFPSSHSFDTRSFEPFDSTLLMEFGISSALGLVVAIFADHQQWQRAFAIKEGRVSRTFCCASALHGLVTLSLGLLGCYVYSAGYIPLRRDLVGFEFVSANYPPVFVIFFVVMAMCALISTLDSALCAFSSLATREITPGAITLRKGRFWMMVVTALGISVALTRPTLLTLWFLVSTIRLSSFIPTVASLLTKQPPTRWHTAATVSAVILGGLLFGAGITLEIGRLRTIGMIISLALPGVILLIPMLSRCMAR